MIRLWICRTLLLSITGIFTYIVTLPGYNFSHWVPKNLLRRAGVEYDTILWAEQNADVALYFGGGLLHTYLLAESRFKYASMPTIRPVVIVCTLCVGAEIAQYLIGRGIETSDLLLGICGSFMAYLAINNKN